MIMKTDDNSDIDVTDQDVIQIAAMLVKGFKRTRFGKSQKRLF